MIVGCAIKKLFSVWFFSHCILRLAAAACDMLGGGGGGEGRDKFPSKVSKITDGDTAGGEEAGQHQRCRVWARFKNIKRNNQTHQC